MKYLFLFLPFLCNGQITSYRLGFNMNVVSYTPKYTACSQGAIYIIKVAENECVLIETFDNETYPVSVPPIPPRDSMIPLHFYPGTSYATTRYSRSPYEIRFDCKWKMEPVACLPKRNLLK